MYLSINETNSEELPASFVMHLDRPLVVSAAILEKIHSTLENFKDGMKTYFLLFCIRCALYIYCIYVLSSADKFIQRSKAFLDCLIIKKVNTLSYII